MHSSADTKSIAKIEELLGCQLTADYRKWLADPDSPNPAPARSKVQAGPPYEVFVTEVFPTHEVLRYVDMERDMIAVGSGDFPPGMIAIGSNGMGDYILLSLRSEDSGTVHFLSHEESNPDDKLWGLYLLSTSFSDWLAALVHEEKVAPAYSKAVSFQEGLLTHSPESSKPWWRFW
jgi:SMI1 / KNR4 family (SUKH-1)